MMDNLEKYTKTLSVTYFTKEKKIDIDGALNKVVYLEVDSPLNYGLRTWNYYGRIINVTKCYFEIIEYCDGFLDNWPTDQILMKEQSCLKKKWARKSIQKLYLAKTEEKIEEREYCKS